MAPENDSGKEGISRHPKRPRKFGSFYAPEMRDDPPRFLGGKKLTCFFAQISSAPSARRDRSTERSKNGSLAAIIRVSDKDQTKKVLVSQIPPRTCLFAHVDRILEGKFESPAFSVAVPARIGKRYVRQFTDSLVGGEWKVVPGAAVDADGRIMRLADDNPCTSSRFYRIAFCLVRPALVAPRRCSASLSRASGSCGIALAEDLALGSQLCLQLGDGDVMDRHVEPEGERRGNSGRVTGDHKLWFHPKRSKRNMRCRDCHRRQEVGTFVEPGEKRAVGDLVGLDRHAYSSWG
jgi:hypothetical protein